MKSYFVRLKQTRIVNLRQKGVRIRPVKARMGLYDKGYSTEGAAKKRGSTIESVCFAKRPNSANAWGIRLCTATNISHYLSIKRNKDKKNAAVCSAEILNVTLSCMHVPEWHDAPIVRYNSPHS